MNNLTEEKLHTLTSLSHVLQKLQSQEKKVVFTNGCFDLIHTGHTRYLRAARDLGDCLVIAVNSDASVRALKGEKRPLIPVEERMEVLAGFYFVDYVLPFEELDPYQVIQQLGPDILVKGGDWPLEKVIGKDIVEARGGKVLTIPEIPGASTTSIVELVLSRYQES